jgi:hypothetical protein
MKQQQQHCGACALYPINMRLICNPTNSTLIAQFPSLQSPITAATEQIVSAIATTSRSIHTR